MLRKGYRRLTDALKAFLLGRHRAYQITFNPEDLADRLVLQDLAKFCRAHESTFHPDARVHAVLEGRREVWLRIETHLRLTPDQFLEIYGGSE